MIILLHNDNQLASYADNIPEVAYELIEYATNPLTIVYSGAKNLAKNVIATDGSIGIRIAKHDFCEQLLQRFRKPIVSTSANLSGELPPKGFHDISDTIKNGVDYVVKYGQERQGNGKSSTVMRLDSSGKIEFLRK